jgi:predicted nucleic acid-binding protein
MIFIDTGYFIALLDPTDALHDRARRWAARPKQRYLVTEYVLWETVNFFLAHPADRSKIHALLDRTYHDKACTVVRATPEPFMAGLKLHRSMIDKQWSLTDCISFTVMRQYGVGSALSHDHHFQQAGFDALLRRDPD